MFQKNPSLFLSFKYNEIMTKINIPWNAYLNLFSGSCPDIGLKSMKFHTSTGDEPNPYHIGGKTGNFVTIPRGAKYQRTLEKM